MGSNSGLMYGLLGSTMTAYFNDSGIGLLLIGFLSLRTLPYSFKFAWAPFIDKHPVPILANFGRRKSWMLSMQALLVVSLIAFSFINIKTDLQLAFGVLVFISFLAASYDIAMDAYRIEFFKKEAMYGGNASVIVGFRVGLIITASIALYMSAYYEWQTIFIGSALCLLPIMLVVCFSSEPKSKVIKVKYSNFGEFISCYFWDPLLNLFKMKRIGFILLIIIFYKVSDGYIDTMLIPFLEIVGFSKPEIATYSKTVGIFTGMLGTVVGAFLLKKMHICSGLILAEILAALSNLTFLLLLKHGYNLQLLIAISSIESFCSGVSNIALISYMSSICNKKFTATHFAILASISSFGRGVMTSFSGMVAQISGWELFFIYSTCLSIPSIICLAILYRSARRS